MEKLQAAIAKARESREEAAPAAKAEAPAPTTGRDPSDAARGAAQPAAPAQPSAWSAVPEMTFRKKQLRRNRVMSWEGGVKAAPYDMLRTRFLKEMSRQGWKRLAITSPTSGCGKTTTCANLAFSLSRQTDLRTIIFDCDLRRSALAKTLGQSGTTNMHEVLEGRVDFAKHAVRIGDNVLLGLSHRSAPDPSELLQSRRAAEVLDQIEQQYQPDVMIFDMPPLLVNDDTIGFSGKVDCAMLIAMAELSTIEDVDVAEKELAAHTNVLGVVLNRCRYSAGQYGYDYEY
ncbi:MAG: CpsD/CapB family tyrosine-protein kinase [Pseudomonadota bacterium]